MRRIAVRISSPYLAKFLFWGFCVGLMACGHSPPLKEYSLARVALENAKKNNASRYASTFFTKAQESYGAAEMNFKKENYGAAKDLFEVSRTYSEKAENQARLQKYKLGETD